MSDTEAVSPITNVPRLIVLLGAGASAEAGVPTSFNMTDRIVELIAREQANGQLARALNFVCGQLMAHQAATRGTSPFEGLDVERVFSAVELLAERNELEVTPFVASWHPGVNTWDSPPLPSGFDGNLGEALIRRFPGDAGRDLIVQLIRAVTGNQTTGATYTRLAERMVAQLRRLVQTTADKARHLAPLIAAAKQSEGLTIATLNYDLSIEQVAADMDVSLSTGIESWSGDRPWRFDKAAIRLLKLHGSIDWSWQHAESVTGHMMYRTVQQAPPGYAFDDERPPVVAFGLRGKMRATGPFLSLLTEFEDQLAAAQHLLIVGYSFRDDHVNEIVRRWTRGDIARTVTVVDPAFEEGHGDGFSDELNWALNPWQGPNAEPAPRRLTVIQMEAGAAFAELFPMQPRS